MGKKYDSYKIVKQKWTDSLPTHWEFERLKNVFAMRKEKNNPVITTNILSLTAIQGVIPYAEKRGTGGNKPKDDLTKYSIARENDLLINCMNVVSGAAGVSKYFGAISPVYYALFPRTDTNVWYYHYLFRLIPFQRSLIGLGKGILMHESDSGVLTSVRMRISMDYLSGVLLPIPPRSEQDQIVRFLDWKVSRINQLIGVKKRQIETLNNVLTAEIERQLNAYPIKETVRLKSLGSFFKGGGFSRENLTDNPTYPAILYGDIYTQYNYKTSKIAHFIDKDAYDASKKITKGDIVMAGTGETKEEIGKPILYDGENNIATGGDVIVFRPNSTLNNEYILYQLYGQKALHHRYISGKGDIIVHIYPTTLGNTIINILSDSDQNLVVKNINKIIFQTDEATKVLNKEIETLQELKTRLISDVVTGQIDVRDIQIPDYEYVEEKVDEQIVDDLDDSEEQED